MKTIKEKNNGDNDLSEIDIKEFNRFPKLYCNRLRRHVFHGVKENNSTQTVKCLSCGQTFIFHIEGRNKIEESLWKKFEKDKNSINLDPTSEKRPKKRWKDNLLIFRGKKNI